MIDGEKKFFSTHLPSSDVLLYLVSAYSLDSATCNEELAAALNAKIRVLPIILEACDWENQKLSTPQAPLGASIPKLSDIHVLPDERLPINEWDPKSKGWQNVVKGIRKVINKMHAQVSDSAKEEVLPEWVFQQGNFLLMLGEIDKAIEAYSHVLGLNPHSSDAYNNRGSAYYSKGKVDKAIQDYDKVIELKPNLAEAYLNRGLAYDQKEEFDKAIENYTQSVDLKPDFAEAYHNRGITYNEKREIDKAIEDWSKAIKLEKNFAKSYLARGIAYKGKGEIDKAISDFSEVKKLNPNLLTDLNVVFLATAHYTYAKMLLSFREWEKGKSELTFARALGIDIISLFSEEYGSVLEFKWRTGIQLPADIVAMLTPRRHEC